jgi:hypothetical protein
LSKIKTSAAGHAVMTRNFFRRLLYAEGISKELNDAWKDVSFAYDELIVCLLLAYVRRRADGSFQTATVLRTEAKVVGVHARVEEVHERIEDVHERVTDVRNLVSSVQASEPSSQRQVWVFS